MSNHIVLLILVNDLEIPMPHDQDDAAESSLSSCSSTPDLFGEAEDDVVKVLRVFKNVECQK